MSPTRKLYFFNTSLFTARAKVLCVEAFSESQKALILNQTIFHAQGGGQPSDLGTIHTKKSTFKVEKVLFDPETGAIRHLGIFVPQQAGNTAVEFEAGETVTCGVDAKIRMHHARLHSAGHVLDAALISIGRPFEPAKGYHFPDAPFVEYIVDIKNTEYDEVTKLLDQECAKLVNARIPTRVVYTNTATGEDCTPSNDDLKEIYELSDNVQNEKVNAVFTNPDISRTVIVAGKDCRCGGTHVASTSDFLSPDDSTSNLLSVTKIKKNKKFIKISYDVKMVA